MLIRANVTLPKTTGWSKEERDNYFFEADNVDDIETAIEELEDFYLHQYTIDK